MIPFSELVNLIMVMSLVAFFVLLLKRYPNGIPRRVVAAFLFLTASVSFGLSLTNHPIGGVDLSGKQDYLGTAFTERGSEAVSEKFRKYYHDNFIFFDCATSLEPGTGLTRRDDLAECLRKLRPAASDIDLIVLDIVFSRNTEFDSLLTDEIDFYNSMGKIILAKDTMALNSPRDSPIDVKAYKEIFGDVSGNKDGGIILTQQLLSETKVPTLPYLAYLKITGDASVQTGVVLDNLILSPSKGYKVYRNDFVVPHFVKAANIMGLPESATEGGERGAMDSISRFDYGKLNYNYFGLNYCREESFGEVIDTLRRRAEEKRARRDSLNDVNIVVFGTVKGTEDLHNSMDGEIYGVEFIINSFIYMKLGYLNNHSKSMFWFFIVVVITTFIHYWLKLWTEEHQFVPGKYLFWRRVSYFVVKSFDDLFLIVVAFIWIHFTKSTLFATNIFFCYFLIVCVTKALHLVEKLKVTKS